KTLGMLPGLVAVAAERNQAIQDQLAVVEIEHLKFSMLNERAYLVDATVENKLRAGLASVVDQGGHFCGRTGIGRTDEVNHPIFATDGKIRPDCAGKRPQARSMFDLLVAGFTG